MVLLRGTNYSKQPEMDEITDVVNKEAKDVSTMEEKIQKLKSPAVFKPLIMMTVLFILQASSYY